MNNYNGSLKLNDIEYSNFNKISFLKVFGIQPQKYHIFNDTISRNITLSNGNYNQEQIDRAIQKAQLTQKVSTLPKGLDTLISSGSETLSGGELQRVSLARFFIRKRPVLIVDEGTSALDKKNAEKVMDVLVKNKELTLFVITHSIDQSILRLFNKQIDLSE